MRVCACVCACVCVCAYVRACVCACMLHRERGRDCTINPSFCNNLTCLSVITSLDPLARSCTDTTRMRPCTHDHTRAHVHTRTHSSTPGLHRPCQPAATVAITGEDSRHCRFKTPKTNTDFLDQIYFLCGAILSVPSRDAARRDRQLGTKSLDYPKVWL